MKKYYYLFSLVLVFIIPSIIQGFFVWRQIDLSNFISFILGITVMVSVWDVWATKHGRNDATWLWQFNERETLGVKMFGLPLEEYLFYLSSSTYAIFIWESLRYTTEADDFLMYLILPFTSLWTVLFILLPYYLAARSGRGVK